VKTVLTVWSEVEVVLNHGLTEEGETDAMRGRRRGRRRRDGSEDSSFLLFSTVDELSRGLMMSRDVLFHDSIHHLTVLDWLSGVT
jgi:hypothetical protein